MDGWLGCSESRRPSASVWKEKDTPPVFVFRTGQDPVFRTGQTKGKPWKCSMPLPTTPCNNSKAAHNAAFSTPHPACAPLNTVSSMFYPMRAPPPIKAASSFTLHTPYPTPQSHSGTQAGRPREGHLAGAQQRCGCAWGRAGSRNGHAKDRLTEWQWERPLGNFMVGSGGEEDKSFRGRGGEWCGEPAIAWCGNRWVPSCYAAPATAMIEQAMTCSTKYLPSFPRRVAVIIFRCWPTN
eukprot:173731-Chlamydomonas_euryale.AAC.4